MDSTDAVSVVALVVSVVALFGTILQLLQQYYASAEGYSNCGEAVMGEWALTRKRHFRYTELRFEVQFETPVIFMCPPTNIRGPLGEKSEQHPLWHVQGTETSEAETRTPSVLTENARKNRLKDSKKLNEDVHTADNERANWFILLQALHAMERESLSWQQRKLKGDRKALGPKLGAELPNEVAKWDKHTVVAALQPKRKSWDTMPSEVKKPYATTTICHMVEMAAMLGLHWREFDRSSHKYHAEGNGYLLTGDSVDDLGIVFRFQIYGENIFEQHRIIPNEEIKLLVFGNVSTIHRPGPKEGGKRPYDNEDPKNTGVLQFGSTTELVESLTHYGCNSKTTNYFRDDKKKHAHLFPVVFEVLGMVAESVYIPDTYYRFLPNPTTFSWNRKNFSLRKLLREFFKAIKPGSKYISHTHHLIELQAWGEELDTHLKEWANEDVFSLALLDSLHTSIKKCDRYLCPPEPTLNERMVRMTKLVVREHVQEVMRLLNETNDDDSSGSSSGGSSDDSTVTSKDRPGHGHGPYAKKTSTTTTFEELQSAAPEVRQGKLMEIYFTMVRDAVGKSVPHTLEKRSTGSYVPSVASRTNLNLVSSDDDEEKEEEDGSVAMVESPSPRPETPQLFVTKSGAGVEEVRERTDVEMDAQLTEEIWCTLVFRMLCWLLLHDFHKKDVQISKSELYGSRLPVYIA